MSTRELAKNLIDQIPETRLVYVISYLQGAAVPDETPNNETLSSMNELDSGGGTIFFGSTSALFQEWLQSVSA